MATRYEQIIANVQSLVNQNAPARDIDGYLAVEGLSPAQFKKLAAGPTIGGQTKEFFKGLVPGAVNLGEAAVTGASALLPEETEQDVRKYVGKKAEGVRKAFAPELGYEDAVPRKLGEAVGSTLPFFALGPLGGAGLVAGTGIGVAAGAGEARQRAEESGVKGSDRALATALGIGPGLLDMVAPELKIAKGIIGRALVKGGVEGATEAAQQVSQNLIAKGIYKPDQPILAGAGEEGAYGAGAGALSSFLLDAALGRRARTTTTTTPPTTTPAGLPATATQGELFDDGMSGFGKAPLEPYREAEEVEGQRQANLTDVTQMRDQHDVLMREMDRLRQQVISSGWTAEDITEISNKLAGLSPEDIAKIARGERNSEFIEQGADPKLIPTLMAVARAQELNTSRADLEKQINKLSKKTEGAERTEDAAGQMGLDFGMPEMPRQKTGEGVVLGEQEETTAGLSPEQVEMFRQERVNDIQRRISAGDIVTPAEMQFLRMDARDQADALAAQPTPDIFTGETQTGEPKQLELPDQNQVTPSGFFQLQPSNIEQPQMEAPAAAGEENRLVTEEDFKAMGIGRTNKKLREALLDKDLSDPAQRAEVKEVLTDFANNPSRSAKVVEGVQKFLESPTFMEQGELDLKKPRKPRAKKEATNVTGSIEPNAGATEQGTAVVGERQEDSTTGTEEAVGGRLDVAPAPTEQIDVGEVTQPTALDQERVDLRTATDRLMFEGNLKRDEATKLARNIADAYDEVGTQDIDDVIQSVKGGKPLYRDNGKGKKGILASRVQKVADTIKSRWKNAPPIKVIQRADELPDRLYQQMLRDKVRPPGAFDPNTGIVYLISDHIIDERDATLTLSHEVLGHYGIRGILGNTYGKVMDDIYNGNLAVRKQAMKKMAEGLDKQTAVEEVLAEMAESGVYNNAIQRIFNAIRQAIRKLGYNFKEVTDTEIRALLANANRFVFSGAQARTDVAAPAFANKPLWRDTTDAFDRWFGNSVIRNDNGTPKVMYHGTAQDIHSFKPKQAGAIFVTDDPNFAEDYTSMSEDWMRKHADQFFTQEQLEGFAKQAKAIAKREGTSDIDEYNAILSDNMPSRANIIPVYVSVQKPFDYENPEHVQALLPHHPNMDVEEVSKGKWNVIELEKVQSAIKAAGFDGFYMYENGRKNLAVYEPGQIKSVFNGGNYDRNDHRILYRTRKEELTPEGQKAAALNERMKGISNPRDDAAESIGKGMAGIKNLLNPKEGPGLGTRFRRAVVDSDATANEKIQADFNNALINAMGDVRADLLVDQAQDATGLAESYMELGNIEINEYGLAQTSKKEGAPTMKSIFDKLHALGDKLGSLPLAVQVAHNALIANRANEINIYNAGVQKEVDDALAKKNTKAAAALENKKVTIRASAEEIAAGLEAKKAYPEIESILKEFTDYKNGLVDFLQQTGRINAETAKNWKENAGYVPWTRIEEEVNTFDDAPTMYKTGLINLSQLPKLDREGSSKEIANVFDNMIGLTNWAIKTGLKTRAASALATQLPDAKEIKTDAELKRELKNNKNRVVFAYKDGERTAYLLGSPLDMSAFSNNVEVLGPIVGSFKYMGDMLRGAITHMPAFALSQLIQDGTYRGMLLSGVNNPFSIPPRVFKNFGRALRGELTELQSLGITGVYDGMPDQVAQRARERYGISERGKIKKAWDKLEHFSMSADLAVRAAIYEQTIAETKSDAMPNGDQRLALYRAKEYINFKRAGANSTVRTMRHMIPFMNAYIQGMDVLTRTMQGKGVSLAEKRQAQMLFFGTGLKIAALNTLYTLLVGDDDDYKGLEEYERDKNYIIPGTGLKIPVAPELGFMFKVIPERVIKYVASQGTERPQDASDFFRGFRDAFVNAYSTPNAMPQAVKPGLEVLVNYSFFTGNPIVGQAMKNVDPSLQFTSGTSEIAKLFGMVGISPMKADHLIRGYTGMVGAIVLDATDAVADPNRPSKPINKLPQISTFMYDPSGRGYKSEFYRFRESVDKVVDTVNLFKREGRVQELHDYLDEDKLKLYAMRGVTSKVEQQLSVLRKYRNIISADPELSGSEKQEKIKEIQEQEKDLLLMVNLPKLRETSGM